MYVCMYVLRLIGIQSSISICLHIYIARRIHSVTKAYLLLKSL